MPFGNIFFDRWNKFLAVWNASAKAAAGRFRTIMGYCNDIEVGFIGPQ